MPLAVVAAASGVETALFSLTYHDRLRLKRLSPRAASAVSYLLARPRTLLVLVLFVTMAASTAYFVLTSLALMASESTLVQVIVGVVNLLLMTLIGEIVSKVLAARYRVELCRLAAPWVLYVFKGVQPFLRAMEDWLVSPLVRLITPERALEGLGGLTEEELDALLHQGSAEGAIDADERRVLGQVIRLSGLRVKDVMTHRVDMQWVDERTTHAEIVALVRSKRVTRLPVVKAGEDIDQGVVGLLDVKRYLAGAATTGREREWRVTDALDPVRYVPASASLDKLLEQFSSAGVKLGLVVDEHGAVVGIVTTENIVQRLIAELTSDEELEIEAQVSHLSDGRWSVPGRLSVRDWASMFGLSGGTLEARVSTVGGLIFAKLGRVPRVGDVVTIGNLRLEVLAMHGRVVGAAAVSLEGKSGRGVEGVAASQARAAGGEPGAAGGEEAKGAP